MKLILINGLPATGKSTIARQLSEKLNLPLISKDGIKEFLFDTLGIGDRELSRTYGMLANDFLYEVCEAHLAQDKSIIIENAFEYAFAKPRVETILAKYPVELVEIYCTADPALRRQRFVDRNESGQRHKGHRDEVNYTDDSAPEPLEKYAPLHIGTLINVATDVDTSAAIDKIIKTYG